MLGAPPAAEVWTVGSAIDGMADGGDWGTLIARKREAIEEPDAAHPIPRRGHTAQVGGLSLEVPKLDALLATHTTSEALNHVLASFGVARG